MKPGRHPASGVEAHAAAILCSDVIGATVKDCNGRKIGEVEDLVFDRESRALVFAIVSVDGCIPTGARYLPMPWQLMRYDQGYVVRLSSERLQGAPVFSCRELVHAGSETRKQVNAYYGISPARGVATAEEVSGERT